LGSHSVPLAATTSPPVEEAVGAAGNDAAIVPDTTKKPTVESGIVEGNEPTTVPETINATASPSGGVVGAEGNDPATVPDTTKKPVVKTGGEKPTNEGDLGDESSASFEELSVSGDNDYPTGYESQGVGSGSGSGTATESSVDEDEDSSYTEPASTFGAEGTEESCCACTGNHAAKGIAQADEHFLSNNLASDNEKMSLLEVVHTMSSKADSCCPCAQ
jgi:hypothetical protein